MFKRTLFFIAPLALLIGCSGNVQNPVDRITYRDEPLVRDAPWYRACVTTTSSTGTASSSPITSVSTVPAGWMAKVS